MDRAGRPVRDRRRARRRDARTAWSRPPAGSWSRTPTTTRGPERVTTMGDRARAGPALRLRPHRPTVPPLPDADRQRAAGRRHPAHHLLVPDLPGCAGLIRTAGRVSSRPMCEHFVARSAEPFRLDDLWPFTRAARAVRLAGFGWGAAWLDDDGRLASYRDIRRSATTPVARRSAAIETTRRARPPAPPVAAVDARPSPTRSRSTTRPAGSPSATTATCATTERLRSAYRAEGRIHGRADTEVGERWLEDAWPRRTGRASARRAPRPVRRPGEPRRPCRATATPHHYAGNDENPVFSFRLGRDRDRVDRAVLARPVACSGSQPRARRSAGSSGRGRPCRSTATGALTRRRIVGRSDRP